MVNWYRTGKDPAREMVKLSPHVAAVDRPVDDHRAGNLGITLDCLPLPRLAVLSVPHVGGGRGSHVADDLNPFSFIRHDGILVSYSTRARRLTSFPELRLLAASFPEFRLLAASRARVGDSVG
jgi:hypothetical protein